MPVNLRRTWPIPSLVRQLKLYGLPQAEFTAARNARAKELRKDDPELAATVAALPKPSAAAAALNELVREDPSEARALIQSGKRLREAQEAAVAGKRGADLQKAIEEHRSALDRVQRDLRRRKLSGATLDKAVKTLRVASVDPELQPLLERGTLHEDLTAAGFGLDPGHRPGGAKARITPARRRRTGRAGQARQKARERLQAARAALTEAKRAARKAEAETEGGGAARRVCAAGGRARDGGSGARSGVCRRRLMQARSRPSRARCRRDRRGTAAAAARRRRRRSPSPVGARRTARRSRGRVGPSRAGRRRTG